MSDVTSHRPTDKKGMSGHIRIGDHWNAITIIALSQSNPLKAVAELVENSIDAGARTILITRGKEKGQPYLRVKDDGTGVRRSADGRPDLHYVATHVCDSVKRRLKQQGARGLQGEFGIGLLSFWTLGEELLLTSTGDDGRAWQLHLRKGDPSYRITPRPTLFPESGTEVLIRGILPGIKNFSGEKIQWYLAAELRDRIRHSDVSIRVVDRTARAEYKVEPRKFEGRLLHELDGTLPAQSEVYAELYLNAHSPANSVALYRSGTRVLENIAELEAFARMPWTSGYVQGIVDAPYLSVTPGTRLGVIHDVALARLTDELGTVEKQLTNIIEDQRRAEEERATREVLRSVQGALKEALLALPAEEYDWFDLHRVEGQRRPRMLSEVKPDELPTLPQERAIEMPAPQCIEAAEPQRQFFDYAGPLFSVVISPTSSVVEVGGSRTLRAVARDRARRSVDDDLMFSWKLLEGDGTLAPVDREIVTFHAGDEPGLTRLEVVVTQRDVVCHAEAQVTVSASLVGNTGAGDSTYQGLPGYTFQRAAGELWRSRYDPHRNLVVINNGHRDFVYAARNKMLKLRYICRLFAKELVLKNFVGITPDQLLERLLELTLYTEENLR